MSDESAWQALDRLCETGEGIYCSASFAKLYREALTSCGYPPHPWERVYRHFSLHKLFSLTKNLHGAVAECGCAGGLSSLELCLARRSWDPTWLGAGFHVFDSFEGLSEPSEKDRRPGSEMVELNMKKGMFAAPIELLKKALIEFPQVHIFPGWIPSKFLEVKDLSFKFVHIDVDLYQPTLDSLEFFYPRLVKGGIIVTDDYDWPGAKSAFVEYAVKHKLYLQTTVTSQGYFVKI